MTITADGAPSDCNISHEYGCKFEDARFCRHNNDAGLREVTTRPNGRFCICIRHTVHGLGYIIEGVLQMTGLMEDSQLQLAKI